MAPDRKLAPGEPMIPTEVEKRPIGGSFRDPSGRVFQIGDRIFRTVNPPVAGDFDFVQGTAFYQRAVREGRLIEARVVEKGILGEEAAGACYVLEHPALPFVSYPYEWPFSALKEAALFHLELHLEALEHGVTLADASAYNVQFLGARPVFIDTLSLRRYRPGEPWAGHRQFCEQFLNPLLLRAFLGVSHNAWYRGTQEGIPTGELRRLLPFRRKLSRRVLAHVILHDLLQRSAGSKGSLEGLRFQDAQVPLKSFRHLLIGLRDWIGRLQPANSKATLWQNYARTHSYKSEEATAKSVFVREFVANNGLRMVWDLGCNTGAFSADALEAGAEYVVGFDSDQGALDLAFGRARQQRLNFQPLFLDLGNPSPSQGWEQEERYGLRERARADGLLALALIHHVCIARNVPLARFVRWLVGLAPRGVVEFVPKEDPMAQQLLRLREDVFEDYNVKQFLACVGSVARVVRAQTISSTGRQLVEFCRYPQA